MDAVMFTPMKWRWEKCVLLFWCWQALRKYYGYTHDCVYGDATSCLKGLNYLRAILVLYYAVQGKGDQGTWMSREDALYILNMNRKYKGGLRDVIYQLNDLIYRWQRYTKSTAEVVVPLPPHRRAK